MMAQWRRTGAILVVSGLLTLGACGGSDDKPAATPTSPAASDQVDESVNENAGCELLSASDRAALLGSKLDAVEASDAKKGAVQCRWSSDKGLIQVTDLAAQDWAKTLPGLVAQMEKSTDLTKADDKAQLAAAKKLLKGAESFDGKQACAAFTTLAELSGDAKGSTSTVTYLPISTDAVGISAQKCTGGRLTSVVFTTPKLDKSKKYQDKVLVALDAAHKRAVAAAE